MDRNGAVEGRVPARLSAAEGRRFGLTVGLAFLALSAVLTWRGRTRTAMVFAALGTVLVLGGLLVPTRLGPVERAWMGLAHAISRVTTPVMMSVVYFIVMTPIGLLMRLLGRTPLKRPAKSGSFWIPRDPAIGGRGDLERQF